VEKIDYLVWRRDGLDIAPHRQLLLEQEVSDIRALSLYFADTETDVPKPTLLMGRGPELAAVASVWVDSIDDRNKVEEALRAGGADVDGYLVTESVPQHRSGSAEITHFTWFPKPDRVTDAEFFRGWHEVHTPATNALHPTRVGYTRDAVARTLTPGSPKVDAIVFEFFTLADYIDPRRLYGSKAALDETMEHLPLFADFDSINSRPLHEVVVKPLTFSPD
jgi:hypothetical protein